MRFLLDVHIATSIGRRLADAGHDIMRAAVDHGDWSDRRLLSLAVREGRILVTEDRDFSDLIYRRGLAAPPAVLYLRVAPTEQAGMADRVLLVLENTAVDGHMIVIRRASVRHRPLPEKTRDHD